MRPVLKTNNPVLLSFAQSLLSGADIETVVFDENASVMEGSLGILPRRLMVSDDDFDAAEAVLREGMRRPEAQPVALTEDRFLGGRVLVCQRSDGFRSGLDAVMLAAAVPARGNDSVLELGSGAGTASLCLATRASGVRVTGAEVESELVTLSNRNATANGLGDRVVFVTVDVMDLPPDMKRDYAHVMCNPPFHAGGEQSPDAMRAGATHDEGLLADWLAVGVRRTAPGGTFTCILRSDRLGEALAALPPAGVRVYPLYPHAGEASKRIIVQVTKASRAPLAMLHGLVLHNADGSYTAEADAVLRGETGLMA